MSVEVGDMDLAVRAEDWFRVIQQEYLTTFIRNGGAAVKVAVAPSGASAKLAESLVNAGRRSGFVTAYVDESVPKVHSIDKLFNGLAKQIEWDDLAAEYVRSGLLSKGYHVEGKDLSVERIAALNSVGTSQVSLDVRRLLSQGLDGNRGMTKDFRAAVSSLCLAVVEPDDLSRETGLRIKEWLRGELLGLTALRPAMIYEKVNRYNARTLLASTSEWVRFAGRSGLLAVVDVSRYSQSKPSIGPDGSATRPPTRSATMDAYEMMRQCIDGTDELEGVLIVFITGPEFLEDEKRGMRFYPALEMRLTNDVRDRSRPNPFAPMVRIAGQ